MQILDRRSNSTYNLSFSQTGLTPLMEASSGGYVDVGRVLIDRGADVNAQPVPSSRDTALTIAADKGHYKFVELLVVIGAAVDVRNKKGCTPLWLSANGKVFSSNQPKKGACTGNIRHKLYKKLIVRTSIIM